MAERQIMITIGADGRAAIKEMGDTTQAADKMGAGVSSAAAKSSSDITGFKKSIDGANRSMGDLVGSAITLTTLVMGIRSVSDAATQTERANIGLAVTARYAGERLEATTAAAKKLTDDGLMPVTQASQALQNLLSRGFSLPEAIQLMERFKDSAAYNRQASLEFGQSIVGATEGLKNENSILVDNAGVTKNVSLMWKEYAAEHGKSVDKLTQAEKRQAEYNGILKETEGQLGNAARMTNSLQGSQARLNKEWFESRTAAGQALVPALTEISKALVPVARGFRDFIGMYQMGIVGTAAFIDKALAIYNKGGILGLLFSSEKRGEITREFAIISQAAAAQQQEIFDRLNAPPLPDIGADSGKRRKDSATPPDLKKGLTAQQKEYQTEVKSFLKDSWEGAALELAAEDFSSDVTKKLGLLTPQRAGFTKNPNIGLGVDLTLKSLADQEAATKKLAEAEAALLAIQTQRWQHQQNMNAITAAAQVAALQFIGQDQAALQARFAAERAATQANYEEQMRLAGENREKQLQAENTFQESKYRIQTEYAQRQAELWWNGAQTYIGYSQQMTTMGLQMLMFDESQRSQIGKRMLATSIRFIAQSVQQYMFGEAKKHLITSFATSGQIAMQMAQHTASLTMLESEAIAWAAFLTALSLNPFGGQAAIPAAAAMTAVAGVAIPSAMAATLAQGTVGAASELSMAGAWIAGGVLVGALGEAGASAIEGGTSGSTSPAGYGAGSPASPIVTTPIAADNRASAPTYNIHIYGNVVDHDKFARELIPAITKATNDGVR